MYSAAQLGRTVISADNSVIKLLGGKDTCLQEAGDF